MTDLRAQKILSDNGEIITSRDGALDVHVKAVNHVIINKSLHYHKGIATTLSVATTGDGTEYQITVASAVGFSIGEWVHIENGDEEPTHAQVLAIAGNVFSLDRRIDLAHPIGTTVEACELDMSTAIGTQATPIEFWVAPPPAEIWQIERIIFNMAHSSAGDLGTFGNISGGLTNGVIVRGRQNGAYRTFTNWKTNGDIKGDMYDVDFPTRSGGGGAYGTSGRGSFNRIGTSVELNGATGDRLEILVQDDLTGLGFFYMKAQGYVDI